MPRVLAAPGAVGESRFAPDGFEKGGGEMRRTYRHVAKTKDEDNGSAELAACPADGRVPKAS